jgi:hypothetical protein
MLVPYSGGSALEHHASEKVRACALRIISISFWEIADDLGVDQATAARYASEGRQLLPADPAARRAVISAVARQWYAPGGGHQRQREKLQAILRQIKTATTRARSVIR